MVGENERREREQVLVDIWLGMVPGLWTVEWMEGRGWVWTCLKVGMAEFEWE